MSILGRYLCRRVLITCTLLLFGMAGFAMTFELMEQSDRILRAGDGDRAALLHYSLLRLPDILSRMLPIATLIAAFLTLTSMLRHSELVAVWGGGVSTVGVLRATLPAGLLLAAVQLGLNDRAVPATLERLHDWGVGDFAKRGILQGASEAVWLRSGRDIVRFPTEQAKSGRLENLQIFRRGADGLLSEHLLVGSARREGATWILSDTVRRVVEPPQIASLGELDWNGLPDVEHLPLIARDLRDLPLADIGRLIDNQGYGQRPTHLYRTWFQYRIASALTPLLMVALVVALAQRFRRTGSFAMVMVSSLAIGFAFFVFDGVSLAIGEAGFVPPWLSAWSPALVLTAVIGSLLVRDEG